MQRDLSTKSNFIADITLFLIFGSLIITIRNKLVQRIVDKFFDRRTQEKENKKASISLYKVFSYTFASIIGFCVLKNEYWICDIFSYMETYGTSVYPFKVRIYYIYEFTFYFIETLYMPTYTLKDKNQMVIHHVITVILILISYYYDHVRIGMIIMLLHDISDPFLESAKICLYMNYKLAADIIFVLFVITFILPRLFIYPYAILYPVTVSFLRTKSYYTGVCIICLYSLFVMHIIWSKMIFKIIKNLFKQKDHIDDVRSESKTTVSTSYKDKKD